MRVNRGSIGCEKLLSIQKPKSTKLSKQKPTKKIVGAFCTHKFFGTKKKNWLEIVLIASLYYTTFLYYFVISSGSIFEVT